MAEDDVEEDAAAAAAAKKKQEANQFADTLTKKHAKQLMLAAGFIPGPNVSLQHAIDTFKKRQFREIFLYSLFLFCFTVSSYTQRDVQNASLYVNSVRSVVMEKPFAVVPFWKGFRNISLPEDCWLYLETVLPAYLFEETWYNGDPIGPDEKNKVLFVNHLVQAPRIRQVRVQSYKCADGPGGLTGVFSAIPQRLKQYLINCYPAVGGSTWAKDEEIPGWPPGNKLKYRSGEELATEYYSTNFEVYEGGGYAIDIPLNTTQADVKAMFRYLMENKWTDLKTRALFFDFVTYHQDQRFFLSVRLTFEFLHIGQIVPTESFRVMRLGFIDNAQYISLVFDVLVHLLLLHFIYDDLERFLRMPKYWLKDLWNYLSVSMYIVFGISLVFKVRFFTRSLPYINSPPEEMDTQVAGFDFESLGWISSQIWNWTAVNSILVWGRAFRFFKYANDAVASLSYAVFDSSTQLVSFFLVFSLLTFAYGVSFHISFGVDVGGNIRGVTGGLGTLMSSIFAQWRLLLVGGSNDFSQIVEANRLLGPLLLLTYQIIGAMIAIKLPAAILNKTYSTISDHGSDDPMAKEFRSVLARGFNRMVSKIFFYGKKDDDELFRLEREAQHEQAFHGKPQRRKKGKKGEDVEEINKNFHAIERVIEDFERNVKVMGVKVEVFVDTELKKFADAQAKHVEPASTLLFGRKEAWGRPGVYLDKPDLSSCVTMMGNKTVLPPNWKLYHSEEGDPFYYNITDDTVQWDPPVVMMAGVIPEIEENDDDAEIIVTKKKKKKKEN